MSTGAARRPDNGLKAVVALEGIETPLKSTEWPACRARLKAVVALEGIET